MKLTLNNLSLEDGDNRIAVANLSVEGPTAVAAFGPLFTAFTAARPANELPPVVATDAPQLPATRSRKKG